MLLCLWNLPLLPSRINDTKNTGKPLYLAAWKHLIDLRAEGGRKKWSGILFMFPLLACSLPSMRQHLTPSKAGWKYRMKMKCPNSIATIFALLLVSLCKFSINPNMVERMDGVVGSVDMGGESLSIRLSPDPIPRKFRGMGERM